MFHSMLIILYLKYTLILPTALHNFDIAIGYSVTDVSMNLKPLLTLGNA